MKLLNKSVLVAFVALLGIFPSLAAAQWTAGEVTKGMIQNAGIANTDLATWMEGLGDGSSLRYGS